MLLIKSASILAPIYAPLGAFWLCSILGKPWLLSKGSPKHVLVLTHCLPHRGNDMNEGLT